MARLSSKKLLFLAGELENGEAAAAQMGLMDAAKLMQAAKAIIVDALVALEARRVQQPRVPAVPKAIVIPFPTSRGTSRQRQLRARPPVA